MRVLPFLTSLPGAAAMATAAVLGCTGIARAQVDPVIGQMILFAGNFCPRGWAEADGRLLAISSNTALFSIVGIYYGGDGRNTFGLPDMRGRAPVHVGQGPGLTALDEGDAVGVETVTLTPANLPEHSHQVQATNQTADRAGPGNKVMAVPVDSEGAYFNIYWDGAPNRTMHPDTLTQTGDSEPIEVRSPAIAMKWCIATAGTYPSRN